MTGKSKSHKVQNILKVNDHQPTNQATEKQLCILSKNAATFAHAHAHCIHINLITPTIFGEKYKLRRLVLLHFL